MSVARDGSPVDVYLRLPELGEGARVAEVVPTNGSILELGCGSGRITRQLIRRGYQVTAVDESAEMLAHVTDAEIVCARIEQLDLGRRFDAVLLASNLINAAPTERRPALETGRRHSDVVIVESLPLGWQPTDSETKVGNISSRLRVERIENGVVHGSVTYTADGQTWEHAFAMHVFPDQAALDAALAEVGLHRNRWLDDSGRWFVACSSLSPHRR